MDCSVTPYFQTILKYSVTLSKNHEKKSDLRTIYYIRSDLKKDFSADADNESQDQACAEAQARSGISLYVNRKKTIQ